MRSFKTFLIIMGLTVASALARADGVSDEAIEVRPDNPGRYTVVRGDTLWDISGKFLKKPWYWRQVWEANPQIRNPHRIYPGDVIALTYVDGRPILGVERGKGTVRLSPQVRSEPIVEEVPTIPIDAIQPFLTKPLVVTDEELEAAPYVLAMEDDHIVGGDAAQRIYVRGISNDQVSDWDVVRRAGEYVDIASGAVLGVNLSYRGRVQLRRLGDPATVEIVGAGLSIEPGDRLFPVTDDEIVTSFYPQSPARPVQGNITAALVERAQLGRLDAVVIDRGAMDGLAAGDVLQIDREGRTVKDPVRTSYTVLEKASVHDPLSEDVLRSYQGLVQLPSEPNGLLMVFRAFPRVSYALILESKNVIHVGDRVRNP